jgi:putative ABC transport system permease protein
MLRHHPGFATVAVLTLALGIGATSAVFSVVNAVLLRPFPYYEPGRLVIVWERNLHHNLPFMFASPPNFADWRETNQAFTEMGAFRARSFFLEHEGEPRLVHGARVTASVFSVLGVGPLIGRVFTPEEERVGSDPVVLLSHQLWQSRYGGDPDIIGRAVRLDEQSHTVVGIMPSGFEFPPPIIEEGIAANERAGLWVPYVGDPRAPSRGAHNLNVIARLKDDVDLQAADADMNTIAARLAQEYPDSNVGWDVVVVPLDEQVVGDIRAQLLILLGAVVFVLLIACVNVANLLLARGTTRLGEFALRASLGAHRPRLVRQLLTESLLLAILGGAIGLILAVWGMEALVRIAPRNIPRFDQTGLDAGVVGFTLLAVLLTGALFGLAPAFQSMSANLSQRLREGGRGQSETRESHRLRSALVIAEIALSLVLLVGASLLFQSFIRLKSVDTGFQAEHTVTMRLTMPRSRYEGGVQLVAAFTELEERLNASAGIQSAGFISDIPLASDRQGRSFTIEGEPPPPPDENRTINVVAVTPGYFRSMGIPVMRGRSFEGRDGSETEGVIIVNDAFVRRHFPTEDPIGTRLMIGGDLRRIVGIVGDVRHVTLRDDPNPTAYFAYYQVPMTRSMSLIVRSESSAEAVTPSVRGLVRQYDAGVPVYDVKTMEQILGESMARTRFSALLMGLFAVVALLLASVGIYGVIAYSVSRRTHELGVRVAMGAVRADILGLVLRQGMRLVTIGILVGLAASLFMTRLLSSLLYGIGAADALTFVGVVVLLLGVAVLACYLPARRATKVDPIVTLRYE